LKASSSLFTTLFLPYQYNHIPGDDSDHAVQEVMQNGFQNYFAIKILSFFQMAFAESSDASIDFLAISALFAASFAACQVAQAAIIVPTALATPITCVVKDVMLEKNVGSRKYINEKRSNIQTVPEIKYLYKGCMLVRLIACRDCELQYVSDHKRIRLVLLV
jgi:hypothetical protein